MTRISSKLDWRRMVGFDQIADQRTVVAPDGSKLGPKVGGKLGVKVGGKLGVKVGQKLGLKLGIKG